MAHEGQHRQAVAKLGRVPVLGRQAVVECKDRNLGTGGELGAHVVMGVDAAQRPAAAMAIDHPGIGSLAVGAE